MFTTLRCKVVLVLAAALLAGSAHAEGVLDYGGPGPSPAPPTKPKSAPTVRATTPTILQLQEATRIFETNGLRIPSGSECEELLVRAGLRLGRFLTHQEIEENLPVILKATGENLERIVRPLPPSPPRFVCFTGDMKVLTPKGEVPISQLKPGDEVVSVDHTLDGQIKLVANRVQLNISHENQSYGLLTDLPRPIQVTPRHQFYASWRAPNLQTGYRAIEDLRPEALLSYGERGNWEQGQCVPTPRGNYSSNHGINTVYDLQLIGHPRNYIVEGVLVHNIMKL